jgi:hypothetical protein
MSVASLVSSAKELVSRRAVIGAAAGLALAASASPALAQRAITPQECGFIRTAVTQSFEVANRSNFQLSEHFRRSITGFIAPDGRTATCTGDRNIIIVTSRDAGAFSHIRAALFSAYNIDLQTAGVRSVPRPELASVRPQVVGQQVSSSVPVVK